MQSSTVLPNLKLLTLAVTDEQYEEFQKLVARGIATWDTAPTWLHDLNFRLHDTPVVINPRSICPTCKQQRVPPC
jgi:hypothetical protein